MPKKSKISCGTLPLNRDGGLKGFLNNESFIIQYVKKIQYIQKMLRDERSRWMRYTVQCVYFIFTPARLDMD
jgi:hypothetical protein